MKYNALIVDDERKLREVLKIKIDQYIPEIKIIDTAASADEAFKKVKLTRPDIVFLDISMPEKSGFDFLDMFDEITFTIIFVTGFSDYALDALKVSAVDYLLKPVDTEELKKACSKAFQLIKDRSNIEKYKILKHNLLHSEDQETKITVPGMTSYDFVKVKDIVMCEGWQKYTKIHLKDGSCITSSYNIGVFKELLMKFNFYSTHKSFLINTTHISRYLKEGKVILTNNLEVPVSRRKKEEFKDEILNVGFI